MYLKARVQIEQAAYLFFACPFLVEFRCDFFPHAALKLLRIRMQLIGQLFRNRNGNFHDEGSIASLLFRAITRCKRRAHMRGVGDMDSRLKTLTGLSTFIPVVVSS